MKRFFAFILPVFLLLLICNAEAATVTASSCSQFAVQSAVTAASTGDTVSIPAGSCTWGSSVSLNKKITLQGAGSDRTIISSSASGVTLLSMGTTGSRITGIWFRTYGSTNVVNAQGKNWRIDHCKFSKLDTVSGAYGVNAIGTSATSQSYGLIDNCEFLDVRILAAGVLSFNEQHKIWAEDAGFGTSDAVYVEDCTFERTVLGNVIDANRGGKYVFRFNTIINSETEAHSLQSVNNRGTRRWEIYNNTWQGETTSFYKRPTLLRAGEGLIFNNTINGTWSVNTLHIDSRRAYDPVPNLCNGTSYLDGNTSGQDGWLCRDQPGAGKDTQLGSGTTFYAQTRSPVYGWGNTYPIYPNLTSYLHIKANRDYYDGGTWGVQTSTSSPFNGTTGTGRGTYANRPSTCTTGVGYWATDKGENWNKANSDANDGALYRCVSTNVWTLAYVPYEYPHPLRSGKTPPPDTDDIKPPGNFRIAN